jgi:transcriptional regulator with XRE-family HTH domain
MNEIGLKVKELRKKKGLSQEELADFSNVNLRTIQRIENNESEPRGKTLSLICDVLQVNIEELLDFGKKLDNSYLILFHLSVLSFIVIPLGNIIIPLILWMNKKDKIIGLKQVGANLLNFQILWCIIAFITLILGVICKILHVWGADLLLVFWFLLCFMNVLLSLIFAFKTKRSSSWKMYYPSLIKLVKE